MRGKALFDAEPVAPKGITPAYAGKRTKFDTVVVAMEDHPRLCGEKQIAFP